MRCRADVAAGILALVLTAMPVAAAVVSIFGAHPGWRTECGSISDQAPIDVLTEQQPRRLRLEPLAVPPAQPTPMGRGSVPFPTLPQHSST